MSKYSKLLGALFPSEFPEDKRDLLKEFSAKRKLRQKKRMQELKEAMKEWKDNGLDN